MIIYALAVQLFGRAEPDFWRAYFQKYERQRQAEAIHRGHHGLVGDLA